MKWISALLGLLVLLVLPLAARAQIAGLIQYDSTGQPLTPYQPVTYFGWLGPHATLPSEITCAEEISYTSPSTVNNSPIDTLNAAMNANPPTAGELSTFHANPNGNNGVVLPVADYANVDGVYPSLLQSTTPPTTDMIIRWAACKWGIDEDTLRAQAWTESTWNAGAAGGNVVGSGSCTAPGLSPSIFNTTINLLNGAVIKNLGGCYNTWGIGQDVVTGYSTTYPALRDSTAFALDFRAAATRGCINGDQVPWFQNNGTCTGTGGHGNCNTSTGLDLDQGCIATHFSGDWWSSAAISYWSTVSGFINTKPWPGGR